MSASCELYPEIDGKPSELFKGLSKSLNDRTLEVYVYANYLQPEVIRKMDELGYSRNSQNQHNAEDVIKFLKVREVLDTTTFTQKKRAAMAVDSSNNTIYFSNPQEALDKAMAFNEDPENKNFVATVEYSSNGYNIVINRKTFKNYNRTIKTKQDNSSWNLVLEAFRDKGIDLQSLQDYKERITPYNIENFAKFLNNLRLTESKILMEKDIELLLHLMVPSSANTIEDLFPNLKREIVRIRGNSNNNTLPSKDELSQIAHSIYSMFRGSAISEQQQRNLERLLVEAKKIQGVDLVSLLGNIEAENNNIEQNSPERALTQTIENLKKEIDVNHTLLRSPSNDKLKTLTDAVSAAVFTLKRQAKKLERELGTNDKSLALEQKYLSILEDIKSSNYSLSCFKFIQEANDQIEYIKNLLESLPVEVNDLNTIHQSSKIIREIDYIVAGYLEVLRVMSNLNNLEMDERISEQDKNNILEEARKAKAYFTELISNNGVIETHKILITEAAIKHYLGPSLGDIESASLVAMAQNDSFITDNLYSMTAVNDPVLAMMGTIIRDAQSSRNKRIADIELRINRANDKLKKAGYTSEFMYDSKNRIISNIDWDTYEEERRNAITNFKRQGLKGIDFQLALREWEDQNTEEIEVDYLTGRTEKVPIYKFDDRDPRNPMNGLSEEQLQYYNTMMQIKGELGTLLPNYARDYYTPPQKRASFLDMVSRKNIPSIALFILRRIKELWKPSVDDLDYMSNVIVDGTEYSLALGDFNDKKLKDIPIFYTKKLSNQDELLKDFSGAMMALATTAINYDVLNEIRDTVELLGEHISNTPIRAEEGNKSAMEIVKNSKFTLYRALRRDPVKSKALVEAILNSQLYGIRLESNDKWYAPVTKTLIKITSILGLSVNTKGMIANLVNGEAQILIEALTGEFYDMGDYLWAKTHLLGDFSTRAPGKIIDFFTNNKNSYDVLLAEIFDPQPSDYTEKSEKRYYNNIFRSLLSKDLTFVGYGIGEYLLHYTTMYAVLNNIKVKLDGKKISLYDAFEKEESKDGNSSIKLKEGVVGLNGEEINEEFLGKIRDRIRYANQTTQGAMNTEDKGIVHTHLFGRFLMNFRQWMVGYYSKRYRGRYWDGTLKQLREGYWRTVFSPTAWKTAYRASKGFLNAHAEMNFKNVLHAEEMTDFQIMQMYNLKRAFWEQTLLLSVYLLSIALGEPDEEKGKYWYRRFMYHSRRLTMDLSTSNPFGAVKNFMNIIDNPIPAVRTMNTFLYPIYGITDITEEDYWLDYGPEFMQNKYMHKLWKNFPFRKQIEEANNFAEDDNVFRDLKWGS